MRTRWKYFGEQPEYQDVRRRSGVLGFSLTHVPRFQRSFALFIREVNHVYLYGERDRLAILTGYLLRFGKIGGVGLNVAYELRATALQSREMRYGKLTTYRPLQFLTYNCHFWLFVETFTGRFISPMPNPPGFESLVTHFPTWNKIIRNRRIAITMII